MEHYTDEQIMEGVYHKDPSILRYLYQSQLGRIERFIVKKGGDQETARDIFQEAMMLIYKKIRSEELVLTCSFSTYLFAICKNLWLQEIRSRNHNILEPSQLDNMVEEPAEDAEISNELVELVKYHFSKLSADCQKVLELHFKRKSLTDICRILGYKDEKYTADRKYRCKKYLFNSVTSDPRYKSLIDGL
jgi:RNA polymerase sigma factor (sigma-70 family)